MAVRGAEYSLDGGSHAAVMYMDRCAAKKLNP
jgi:hypothetical protein